MTHVAPEAPTTWPLAAEQRAVLRPHKVATWQVHWERQLLGGWDPERVARALGVVLERHQTLRMRASIDPPQQWFVPTASVTLVPASLDEADAVLGAADGRVPLVDVADADLAATVKHLGAVMRPDPVHTLAWAAALVRHGDGDLTLVARLSHLASDAWSTSVLDRDLQAAYAAPGPADGGPEPEVPAPARFTDHLERQHAAAPGLTDEQREHWTRVIDGAVRAGTDRLGPRRPRYRTARTVSPEFGAHATSAAAHLARTARCSPSAVWLAVLALAVGTELDLSDFLVYALHHGRDQRGLADVVGPLARSTVVRISHEPDTPVVDYVRRTAERTTLAARMSHAPFCLPELARELGLVEPGDPPSASVLSCVTLSVRSAGRAGTGRPDGGRSLAPFLLPDAVTPAPPRPHRLWLLAEIGANTYTWAEHDKDDYPRERIARILVSISNLLTAAAAGSERSVGDVVRAAREAEDREG